MSLVVRFLGYAVTSLALLVGLAIIFSLLVGLALWVDDALYRARVRRDIRLIDEGIRAQAEAGMRDFEALLADHREQT